MVTFSFIQSKSECEKIKRYQCPKTSESPLNGVDFLLSRRSETGESGEATVARSGQKSGSVKHKWEKSREHKLALLIE